MAGVDPRADALEVVGGRYRVRVLEPSIPVASDPPWFADDPVNLAIDGTAPLVSPVPNGDVTWEELARGDGPIAAWCADHWLGGWRSLEPVTDLDALARTRAAWHTIAERVLAPARHRATGKIGLRFTAGGFGTPFFVHDAEPVQLRVVGTEVCVARVTNGTPRVRRAALAAAAIAPDDLDRALVTPDLGVRALPYETTTDLTDDDLAAADETSARVLGDWFGFGCSVLEQLRHGKPDAAQTRCQLWPEHFDLSVELGDEASGRRATFGASPGDNDHPEPYLYVSPWADPPADPFWNDPAFGGASLPHAALTGDPTTARSTAFEFFATAQGLFGHT